MPGGLERQNAFFSEYYSTKRQCQICKQYESDRDWIKIHCYCNRSPASPDYVYTHRHCLRMSGTCKKCGHAYVRHYPDNTTRPVAAAAATSTPPTTLEEKARYQHLVLEFMRKNRAPLALFVCCMIGLSICYEALDCITIDLLLGEELQGLTDAEYLYLPV